MYRSREEEGCFRVDQVVGLSGFLGRLERRLGRRRFFAVLSWGVAAAGAGTDFSGAAVTAAVAVTDEVTCCAAGSRRWRLRRP